MFEPRLYILIGLLLEISPSIFLSYFACDYSLIDEFWNCLARDLKIYEYLEKQHLQIEKATRIVTNIPNSPHRPPPPLESRKSKSRFPKRK